MVKDLLCDSRYSVQHAKRRLDDLERELGVFRDSDPYARVIEPNADGTGDVHKVKLVQPIPDSIPGIVSDILNALRSSLDQAGHAVAVAAETKGKHSSFPFGDSLDEVNGRALTTSRDIPKEVFEVMVALGPYKGGNDLLWAMNKLCNTYKHRLVIRPYVSSYYDGVRFHTVSSAESLGAPEFYSPIWDPVKNEMNICFIPKGETCEYHLNLKVDVTINDPKIMGMRPASALLRDLHGVVEDCLAAVKAEARRLGLCD